MNYKDTVIKNKDIKWKHPKIEYIEDGKVDMILTIPLTDILKLQAFRSFAAGAKSVFDFFNEHKGDDLEEMERLLRPKLSEWGLIKPAVNKRNKGKA